MVNASIVTIGDELLIGQVIDTNSAFIAQELNAIGIGVLQRVAVGDNYNQIWQILDLVSLQTDIIIITGGLGPTADDITKPLLCKYFGGKMIIHEPTQKHVIDIFTKMNRPILERNLKQAEVPDCCTVLFNKLGTAPGMLFEKNGKVFISLPGVPHEMKGLIKSEVLPILINKFKTEKIEHRTLLTVGVGESFLAEEIKDFENALPKGISMAYLPNYGMVRLRLTAKGNEASALIEEQFSLLQQKVKPYMAANYDATMEKIIFDLFTEKNLSLSTAESCTGGYIAHLITALPGASKFYKGSIISYANEIKQSQLNINENDLSNFGAVSEQVVSAMALNACRKLNTNYALATSGILGPTGATETKPIGLVFIAVSNGDKTKTMQLNLRFDRIRNMQITAAQALNLLRVFVLENDQ